ncbi:hypothetical protein O6H91_08G108400 [Diphasiastrum complanatum]|uniref:Uncharacterized protein n=1 Tax=Diphasiastrum complanatum TaxID=34168 RepID=A0ACC2D0N7_DIPCM|nr:hypothetical protein O6H91_08G108400 [Diphasiastrum complanatum]
MKRQAVISRFFAPKEESSQPQPRLPFSAPVSVAAATVAWPPAASSLHHAKRKRLFDQSELGAVAADAALGPQIRKRRSSLKRSSSNSVAEFTEAEESRKRLGFELPNPKLQDDGEDFHSSVPADAEGWDEGDCRKEVVGSDGELTGNEIRAMSPGMLSFKRRKRIPAEKDPHNVTQSWEMSSHITSFAQSSEDVNLHISEDKTECVPNTGLEDSFHHSKKTSIGGGCLTDRHQVASSHGNLKKEIPASDTSRHKKFVEKLLARTDDTGVLQESWYGERPSGNEKHTPLEQQVVALKARYPDIVLMVEVGYKYRFFGEDAETAARVLGIFAYYSHNFLTASIPTFRLHVHVRRLVEAGYKVGVVRQTETAAIKAHGANKTGPFTRELSALYTRATLEAGEYLGGSEEGGSEGRGNLSNYLMCIVEQPLLQGVSLDKLKASPGSKGLKKGMKHQEKEGEKAHTSICDTKLGVIAVETSTGDVIHGQFLDTVTRVELEARLLSCSPAELLLASPLSAATEKLLLEYAGPMSNIRVERVHSDSFKSGGALAEVVAFYGSGHDSDLNLLSPTREATANGQEMVNEGMEAVMAMSELVIQALMLAIRYLKQFHLENVLRFGANFHPFAAHDEMILSPNTIRQLEVLKNNANGDEKGSLLWLMDQTSTSFGARLLRHWVTHPLRDRMLISARLDAVCEIADSMGSLGVSQSPGTFPGSGKGGGSVGAGSRAMVASNGKNGQGLLASTLFSLGKMPDIERGITRIFHRTATTGEFISVVQALVTAVKKLQRLRSRKQEADGINKELPSNDQKSIQSPLLRRLLAAAASQSVSEHGTRFLSSLNTEAATSGDKLNLFLNTGGRFPEVARCREAIEAAEQEMTNLLPSFRKLLRIPNLQYLINSGTTHLIEVPAAQRVPADWIKVNSTKKTTRYHPPDVLEILDKLTLAKEELSAACSRAWDSFLAEFSLHYVDFRAAVQALAGLDCLHSLAIVSRNQGYCRPEFFEESHASQLTIEAGRHPVLESVMQDGFVSNDTTLHGEAEHCQIITGPNMGGKSCYMRQVALIVIMAQVGSFVPAGSAKMHVFDSIYTRMGASDGIQHGSSTFLEELSETSSILQNATPRSLIAQLVQEFPGHIQAYHVSYLAEEPSEVVEKVAKDGLVLGNVAAHQEHIEDAMKKITFLYKIVPGVASRSFGLHVARLAQISEACVLRAAVMAAKFEKDVSAREHAYLEARLHEISVNHAKLDDLNCNITALGNYHGDTLEGCSLDFSSRKMSIGAKCEPGPERVQEDDLVHKSAAFKQLTEMLASIRGALELPTSEEKVNTLKRVQQFLSLNLTYS